jgi:hypothetical protein
MATLAFARDVRGGSAERVHRGAQGRHRGRGCVAEMTWIGSRDDHP